MNGEDEMTEAQMRKRLEQMTDRQLLIENGADLKSMKKDIKRHGKDIDKLYGRTEENAKGVSRIEGSRSGTSSTLMTVLAIGGVIGTFVMACIAIYVVIKG